MSENIVSSEKQLGIFIKLKDDTLQEQNLYEKYHQKIVNTMNFLIDQTFESRKITSHGKSIDIKTTIYFPKIHSSIVQHVLDNLCYLAMISNWNFLNSLFCDVEAPKQTIEENDFSSTTSSSFDLFSNVFFTKSDTEQSLKTSHLVSCDIWMKYCGNISSIYSNVEDTMSQINDIIEKTNTPLDMEKYEEFKKLFDMDDTTLRIRYDEKDDVMFDTEDYKMYQESLVNTKEEDIPHENQEA
jgi:hypothetical protein